MDLLEFWTICSSNGIVMDKEQMRVIERYAGELIYWNSKVNLISRKDEENILEKHILHSLAILKYFEPKPKAYMIDIGTGGGLPGIPLKIAVPDLRMTLVDAIIKKTKLTDMFAKHTGMRMISAINGRAEELSQLPEHKGKYDYVTARAVSKMDRLISWSHNFLKKDGTFIFLKGGDLSEEYAAARLRFPNLEIKEHLIHMIGAEWMAKEEKKVVICKLKD